MPSLRGCGGSAGRETTVPQIGRHDRSRCRSEDRSTPPHPWRARISLRLCSTATALGLPAGVPIARSAAQVDLDASKVAPPGELPARSLRYPHGPGDTTRVSVRIVLGTGAHVVLLVDAAPARHALPAAHRKGCIAGDEAAAIGAHEGRAALVGVQAIVPSWWSRMKAFASPAANAREQLLEPFSRRSSARGARSQVSVDDLEVAESRSASPSPPARTAGVGSRRCVSLARARTRAGPRRLCATGERA